MTEGGISTCSSCQQRTGQVTVAPVLASNRLASRRNSATAKGEVLGHGGQNRCIPVHDSFLHSVSAMHSNTFRLYSACGLHFERPVG